MDAFSSYAVEDFGESEDVELLVAEEGVDSSYPMQKPFPKTRAMTVAIMVVLTLFGCTLLFRAWGGNFTTIDSGDIVSLSGVHYKHLGHGWCKDSQGRTFWGVQSYLHTPPAVSLHACLDYCSREVECVGVSYIIPPNGVCQLEYQMKLTRIPYAKYFYDHKNKMSEDGWGKGFPTQTDTSYSWNATAKMWTQFCYAKKDFVVTTAETQSTVNVYNQNFHTHGGAIQQQIAGGNLNAAQQQAKACEGSGNGGNFGAAQQVCCASKGVVCCGGAAFNTNQVKVLNPSCPSSYPYSQ